MRRALLLGGAALLLGGAAALLLLASDARRWETRLAQDDLAFRHAPGRPDLWEARELVPGGTARALLGIDDDLAFRDALRLFRLGRPRQSADDDPRLSAVRDEAQAELTQVGRGDPESVRRSQATNLLGVAALGRRRGEGAAAEREALERGIASFRDAVQQDGSNEQAKYNLELALRRADPSNLEGTVVPLDSPGGAGLQKSGSGY
jgi:hypothetical protein